MPLSRPARLAGVLVAAAAVTASLLGAVPSASAAPSTQTNTGVNMADPGYLKTPGYRSGGGQGTSYFMLYGTGDGGGFPVRYKSGGYAGTYRAAGSKYALPAANLPSWVGVAPKFGKRLWAPTVFVNYLSDDRYYYVMYFSAWHKNREQSCIGTATSSSAFGPFTVKGGPICPPAGASAKGDSRKPEAIDPTNYRDSSGRNYLLFKTSIANEKRWIVWGQRMDANGVYKAKGATPQKVKQFDAKAENPAFVRRGKTLWMFVSGGQFDTCDYNTAVWKASGLGGPWTRANAGLITRSSTGLCGPGGASITRDGSAYRIAYHAWLNPSTPGSGARRTYVATLKWNAGGNPYVG